MKDTISAIAKIIDQAEKFKNAYFWSAPGCAGLRRSYEKSNTIPAVEWSEGGHTYSAAYKVTCSCKNVYACGEYYRDGKRTTLTAIKNSHKRLCAGMGVC